MKEQIANIQYLLEEQKIKEDYEELKVSAKVKIKLTYENGFECFDYYQTKSDQYFKEIERLKTRVKNGVLLKFEVIN